MAYITTQEVKEIRNQIKAQFPTKEGWKFSVTRRHSIEVIITVVNAPIDLMEGESENVKERGYYNVNTSWVEDNYKGQDAKIELFNKLDEIARSQNWFDKSDSMTDYFHTAYYYSVNVGTWEKHFTVAEPKAAKKPAAPAVEVEKIDYSQYCDETLATTYEPIVEVLEDIDAVDVIEIENEIEDAFDYWAVLDEKPAAPVVEIAPAVEIAPVDEVETVEAKPQPATEEEIYNTIETIIREDSNSLSGVTISLYKGVTFIGCFKTIFGAKKIASYMGVGNYNLIGDSSYKYNNSFRVM